MSVEDYDKLRGELNKIFMEGENFIEEDEVWSDLISDSLEPNQVLEIARDLKEEGNYYFKLGKFENALERYGNAELILLHSNFEEKVDRIAFCDLALCILLNSSACFSKLKEFERVGQVCSIILDFQPNNVKAIFRRAMAAVELGRHEWAYWDLKVAAEISPENQEVSKKLEDVRSFINRKKSKDQAASDCPKGLGLGLPPHLKKSKDNFRKDLIINQDESQGKDPVVAERKDAGDHFVKMSTENEKESSSTMETNKPEGCPNDTEDKSSCVFKENEQDGIKDVKMEDARRSQSTSEPSSTITNEDDILSSVCDDADSRNPNLEKPIYRFHNRNKRGSKLTISRGNYHLMTQGKTLKFYNTKLGSVMEVKIANMSNETIARNDDDYFQEEIKPLHCENLSSLIEIKQDITKSEEVQSETGSCVTSDDDHNFCAKNIIQAEDGCATSQFSFSANSKCKARRRNYDIKTHRFPRDPVKINRRRKRSNIDNASSFPTNFNCGCRFEVGKKRKFDHLLPMDFHYHSRKRLAPHDSYCINTCNVGSSCMDASMLESVNPCKKVCSLCLFSVLLGRVATTQILCQYNQSSYYILTATLYSICLTMTSGLRKELVNT